MSNKANEQQRTTTRRTSSGVLMDMGDAQDVSTQESQQKKPKRKQEKRRKQLASVLSITAMLGCATAFSMLFGDDILEPSQAAVVNTPAAATATVRPTQKKAAAPTQAKTAKPTASPSARPTSEPSAKPTNPPAATFAEQLVSDDVAAQMVWVPESGSRYHKTEGCSGMKNAKETTIAQAISDGFTACKRCKPMAQ